ncbi:MAG: 1,4-dihydroxy-2-naphthoate octaprenyltransferase, partial [Bacteroidales bacterium]|nr:1,4-dihydroxy-2-naphthoate octaprenyltransferase [Bacteroidales bacterium]
MKKWIEAMRLRTLPVSISGVLVAMGCMLLCGLFSMVPALLCLVFAVLAQIASNFANEYFDYKNGLDRKGRVGFRRGVTEGDITPDAMKRATFITLALASAVGCAMLLYGPWWLILVGVSVGIFALAYSAGPYPLSHHGLGDVAVIIFFGIVPVTLTCYLQAGGWYGWQISLPASVAVGLMAANVLIVNNYRDMEDDASVNKRT